MFRLGRGVTTDRMKRHFTSSSRRMTNSDFVWSDKLENAYLSKDYQLLTVNPASQADLIEHKIASVASTAELFVRD